MNPVELRTTRRRMRFAEWPEADKSRWRAATTGGDIFEAMGPAAHWRPATRRLVANSFGHWLAFLEDQGALTADGSHAEHLDRNLLVHYVSQLRENQRTATVIMRLTGLASAVRVMAPTVDIAWLRSLIRRLHRDWDDKKPKLHRIRANSDLFKLGVGLMHEVETEKTLRPITAAIRYRDGLIIALLAARPLRVSNLAGIRLRANLAKTESGFWLRFLPEETKHGQQIDVPVPESLHDRLERYLATHRKTLLQNSRDDHLWITKDGAPLRPLALRARVLKWSSKKFGVPITPHLFRDCAATSLAIEDPVHVRMAASLLGHRSLQTTERHYIQAGSLEASRQFHAQIRRLRGKPTPVRRKSEPQG